MTSGPEYLRLESKVLSRHRSTRLVEFLASQGWGGTCDGPLDRGLVDMLARGVVGMET